jgi:Flp pilus assembly protein TadG
MTTEIATMSRHASRQGHRSGERGQVLIIFVIAVFAIIGMVGLVLDGGSAYAQRRDEQNVADIASVAGATAYLNTVGGSSAKSAAATAAAHALAVANGYAHGTNGVSVNVQVSNSPLAATVKVDITKSHRNNFAAIMGMPTWAVSVTATALSSENPNAANGVMPLLFNEEAFPGAICDEEVGGCVPEVYQEPGSGNEDVPQDATQFNWTIFCTAGGSSDCNADTNGVEALVQGGGEATTISIGDDIGPLNAGSHTALFYDLEAYIGGVFPVPIVDDDGNMVGFAYFRLLSVEGASEKVVRGYFVSPINGDELVVDPDAGEATLDTGVYKITLTN